MWQRALPLKIESKSPTLFIWSRQLIQRQYSNNVNTSNLIDPEDKTSKILSENVANPSSSRPRRRRRDEEKPSIIIFPGEGTIKVGQIKRYLKLSRVKEMFNTARRILGYDLLDICLQGPQEKLDKMVFNQPATLVQSMAAVEKMWEDQPRALNSCKTAAGYSIGEISALIFSGALSVEDGIKLAGVRGLGMQFAAENTKQGMLLVQLNAKAKVSQICKDATRWAMDMGVSEPICSVASHLSPKVKIFAGHEEALSYIEKNSSVFEINRVERIPGFGAHHSALMLPALKSFKKALENVDVDELRIEVYSNFKGQPYESNEKVKKYLMSQIVAPIKWEQTLHSLYNDCPGKEIFPTTFDMGSGGLVKPLIEKFNLKAAAECVAV